ncbi:MAG: PilZ domain-containing protein [Desulfobulbaceae bacterium]|nr:PilZ domain-containing protein [Desulfobulbaceae bacterium]
MKSWVPHPAGYEYTKSAQIIAQTINKLIKKGTLITVLHKDYQSGVTVVVNQEQDKILIDKPKDWPNSHSSVRVVFRNSAKLWCHFSGKILAVTASHLHMQYPQELFMLQRRAYFRVNLPENSVATFMYNGKKCKLIMKDLSARGMLVCTKPEKERPQKGHSIRDISITIPSEDGTTLRFRVKQGEIVRAFINDRTRLYYLGVEFAIDTPDEEKIMKYIRQRELALLRKGVQNL